jgi:4-hydroxythreonine-4-phosphate dehydrogenase
MDRTLPDTDVVILTCGEPAGIGPDIAIAARRVLGSTLPFAWLGDPRHLGDAMDVALISHPAEAVHVAAHRIPVLAHGFDGERSPGLPQPAQAQGVIDVIAKGVGLVMRGDALALCTAPIHKKALKDGAGFAFPGHTEFLAHLAGSVPVAMMLACEALRVVPVTIHIALSEVPAALTPEALATALRLTHAGLVSDFGIAAPRIAVAGLNPHAGEGGAMGTEELRLMIPVLDRLRAEGLAISGPHSADTLFHPAARARYDAAVCMYHDQALIPIKTLDFSGGVNVTLGLPFVRTSPDHGTAFDIAGKGLADPTSLIAALKMARDMGLRRRRDAAGA